MTLPPFTFSPFVRPLGDLDATDLDALRGAAEGWHLDYKRDVPSVDSAAKSLSSFANTYGGWVIYGVNAPGGGSPFPDVFPGVDVADVARVHEVLQRAAGTKVNPSPFFQARVVEGPAADVGLPVGRAIVVVRVPPGAHAPYVHGNGRIYRRVADSSEPKHETDRHVLDLLWERSQRARDRWADLIGYEAPLSKGEEDTPTAHVFMSCDPFGDRGSRTNLSFEKFVEVMRDSDSATGGLPFDNFYPNADGYIARQTNGNDSYDLVLTWRQQFDSTAVLSFPIPWVRMDEAGMWALGRLGGYSTTERFAEMCREGGPRAGRVLDLNLVPFVIHGVLVRYRTLLAEGGIEDPFFVKVRVDDSWRTIPFIDLNAFVDAVASLGVPLVQDSGFYAPPGDSLVKLEPRSVPFDETDLLVDTITVAKEVAAGLGVRLPVQELVGEMNQLLARAWQVQKSGKES